ncbi:MAG: MFS transporter [Chloroflexi bacterium]|nr:MFS transporter [Chloroflexota bacterium]
MSNSTADPEASPPGGRPRPWEALRYRDYRVHWLASFSYVVGFWLRFLTLAQWLFDSTGSAAQLGLIGLVQLFVQIPALLWGGTIADRFDRKRVLFFVNMVTMVVVAFCGFLAASDLLTTWHVYVAIAITAGSHTMAQPARGAMTAVVVPPQHIMLAVTTDRATQNVAMIFAPLLFAVVASTFGLTTTFFLAAVVILPAALLPLLIRVSGQATGGSDGSTAQRVVEGFRFVARHPILPGLFLLDTGITVVSFYREILPVLARGLFRGGAGAVGVLGAANSAGAVIGSFAAIAFVGYRAKGMLVLYATLAYAFVLFGFGSVTNLWLGAMFIALLGGTDAVTVAVRETTVQLTTPDHMRGRAYSFMILTAQTANNLGTIWVGFWSASIGAPGAMQLGAVVAVLATLVIWRVWRPIREYRYP